MIERHHARNGRVFGSVHRGEDTPSSDLDLLVDPTEETSLYWTVPQSPDAAPRRCPGSDVFSRFQTVRRNRVEPDPALR
nr:MULTISPECIES: nucleotidyltransferase domain-containing protein [unclassified Thioalkalivibrio]